MCPEEPKNPGIPPANWEILLDGSIRDRALVAIEDIATMTGKPIEGLDEAMVEANSFLEDHTFAEEGFDQWFGLVGHGIYALPHVAGVVAFLDAQKTEDDKGTFWPNISAPGLPSARGIEKWCNGMAGIAAALLAASQKLGHPEMREWSIARARELVEYSLGSAQPDEVSLCHGTAGLGHIFHRIFHQTGDEFFADPARFYLQMTLDLQKPGYGVGSFTAYGRSPMGDFVDMFDPGLMIGSSGVGLALLAAVGNQVPHWDQALLLS